MKSKRPTIKSISKEREIGVLLHFTQAANLPGIVRHGLLPRRELKTSNVAAFASDQYRLDANDDAISISISRTHEAMFASKRKKCGHDNWVST